MVSLVISFINYCFLPRHKKLKIHSGKLGWEPWLTGLYYRSTALLKMLLDLHVPFLLMPSGEMTIADAINIIKGSRDAATQYFRNKTTEKLITAFSPIIKSSLDKFSATKYYGDIINTYNGFPTTLNKLNPDLPSYVVGKAVDALFDQIAQEEANIRSNAAARTTEILKKVFGSRI